MFVRIEGKTQSYDWGKLGASSKVAELASDGSSLEISAYKPYAEVILNAFLLTSSCGWARIQTARQLP